MIAQAQEWACKEELPILMEIVKSAGAGTGIEGLHAIILFRSSISIHDRLQSENVTFSSH